MKIRSGFVSNSSSSSFIVHKSTVEEWQKLIGELSDLEEKQKEEQGSDYVSWGEDGYSFEVEKDFLRVQYAWKPEAHDIVKKYVDLDKVFHVE